VEVEVNGELVDVAAVEVEGEAVAATNNYDFKVEIIFCCCMSPKQLL
jgi:hypothetical protein